MAEVFVEFDTPVTLEDGRSYMARVCGDVMRNGLWQAWIEFLPVADGDPVRSGRETTQPNRADTVYWATGLTPVYLEGALYRALNPLKKRIARRVARAIFDEPAPGPVDPTRDEQ